MIQYLCSQLHHSSGLIFILHFILYYNLVLHLGIRWHCYTLTLICCFIAVSDFLKWIPKRCSKSESSACLGSKFDPISSKSNLLVQVLSNSGLGLQKFSFIEFSLAIWGLFFTKTKQNWVLSSAQTSLQVPTRQITEGLLHWSFASSPTCNTVCLHLARQDVATSCNCCCCLILVSREQILYMVC